MNEQTLSQRLERVAALVPSGARLADIGSDHAYLPVALLKRGIITSAVAGDVALPPFRAAERTVRENGLQSLIRVRLASGLEAIEPEDGITAITLCGMGGERIRDILEAGRARLNGSERLILQPNGGEQPLRLWLMTNGYRIQHEDLLRENRFYYEIIVAERNEPASYSPQELYFGPLQLKQCTPEFLAKWQRLLRLKHKTLASFSQARRRVPAGKLHALEQQLAWISALLR